MLVSVLPCKADLGALRAAAEELSGAPVRGERERRLPELRRAADLCASPAADCYSHLRKKRNEILILDEVFSNATFSSKIDSGAIWKKPKRRNS